MSEQQIEKVPEWTLGWRIRRAMSDAGVTREQLAEELGYSPNTISNWMHDKTPVRPAILKQIALRCEVSYRWLKTGVATPIDQKPSRSRRGAQQPPAFPLAKAG